jgi:carboxyl-terminal processing protease
MLLKKIMKKYKTTIVAIAVAVVSVISYSFVEEYFEVTKNLDIFASVFRDVNIYYVDSIDPGTLMKKGVDEMLNTLDPYTNYIPESEIQDYRFITSGLYGGIGAMIKQKGDYIVISDPYYGYPAQRSGILAGDVILKIDGVSAKGKKTDEISHKLKGSPGTKVSLIIQRDDVPNPFEKILTREEIKVKSVPYFGMIRDGIGYIKLNSFTESASTEIKEALAELKSKENLRGLVLDIRGNPGGLLNEAVNVSNIFVDKGQEIVSTKGKIKDNNKTYKSINDAVDKDIPLVVLVNSSSASASEIVSGALQDLDRAVIIGQRTFGKGLVQTTRPMPYNSQLKITSSKYFIPSGRCIQALDYSHRNEDGSVGKIPDSLVTAFKTHSGRTVYNGGGILPDIVTAPRKLSNISASLINKNIVFDYATRYYKLHPDLTAKDITLTDSDFKDFQAFISTRDYDYTTKSENSLNELAKNAEEEKYYTELKGSLDSLKIRLAHNKQEDVLKNKEEIISLIEEEISARYFFQAGRIKKSLTHDLELEKAISVIKDQVYYTGILSGVVKTESADGDSDKK